ncbi:unnamed protein product [Adineta steineri]|uniref:Uncharacterized protein n=1 Tax=Adineta steineri TaxID=433720 RepID=A0A819S329_9BILA|nr:unnamed protein product [Adineta steineri]
MLNQSYDYSHYNDTEEDIPHRELYIKQLDYLADKFNLLIERQLCSILKQKLIDEIKNNLLLLIHNKYITREQFHDFNQTFNFLNKKCKLFLTKNQSIKQTKQFPLQSSILSGNKFFELLIQDDESIYILDKNLNIIKYIEWKLNSLSKIIDSCWSTTLNSFLILTSSNLYTINKDTYQLHDICKQDSYCACTCNQSYLYLTTGKVIEIYNIFDLKYISSWKIHEDNEIIEKLHCLYDEEIIAVLTYEINLHTEQKEKVIYFFHSQTMQYLSYLSISSIQFDCLWIFIGYSIFNKWNIKMNLIKKKRIMMKIECSKHSGEINFFVDRSISNDITHAVLLNHDIIVIQTDDNKFYICNMTNY